MTETVSGRALFNQKITSNLIIECKRFLQKMIEDALIEDPIVFAKSMLEVIDTGFKGEKDRNLAKEMGEDNEDYLRYVVSKGRSVNTEVLKLSFKAFDFQALNKLFMFFPDKDKNLLKRRCELLCDKYNITSSSEQISRFFMNEVSAIRNMEGHKADLPFAQTDDVLEKIYQPCTKLRKFFSGAKDPESKKAIARFSGKLEDYKEKITAKPIYFESVCREVGLTEKEIKKISEDDRYDVEADGYAYGYTDKGRLKGILNGVKNSRKRGDIKKSPTVSLFKQVPELEEISKSKPISDELLIKCFSKFFVLADSTVLQEDSFIRFIENKLDNISKASVNERITKAKRKLCITESTRHALKEAKIGYDAIISDFTKEDIVIDAAEKSACIRRAFDVIDSIGNFDTKKRYIELYTDHSNNNYDDEEKALKDFIDFVASKKLNTLYITCEKERIKNLKNEGCESVAGLLFDSGNFYFVSGKEEQEDFVFQNDNPDFKHIEFDRFKAESAGAGITTDSNNNSVISSIKEVIAGKKTEIGNDINSDFKTEKMSGIEPDKDFLFRKNNETKKDENKSQNENYKHLKEEGIKGAVYISGSGTPIEIKEKIGSGGEGDVFNTGDPDLAVKIFNPKLRRKKEHIINDMLDIKMNNPFICWPIDKVIDIKSGEFIGYLMPNINNAYELSNTVMLGTKEDVRKEYLKDWDRENIVDLIISILDIFIVLHQNRIYVGDINPRNIMFDKNDPKKVYFLDCDSYGYGRHYCDVGTNEFTSPRIYKEYGLVPDFSKLKRNYFDELYAITVLIFSIWMLGNYPFSAKGDMTIQERILNHMFAYSKNTSEQLGNASLKLMYSNLSPRLKGMFENVFTKDRSFKVPQWKFAFKELKDEMKKPGKEYLKELIPVSGRGVETGAYKEIICSICNQKKSISTSKYDSIMRNAEEKKYKQSPIIFCSDCDNRLKKLQEKPMGLTCAICKKTYIGSEKEKVLNEKFGWAMRCPECRKRRNNRS